MSTPAYGQVVSPLPTHFGGAPYFSIDYWFVTSSLFLRDDDGSVFDDALIPTSIPEISEFEATSFSFSRSVHYLDENIQAANASLFEAVGFVVPEPTTGALVGSVVMVLALGSRRSVRRRR